MYLRYTGCKTQRHKSHKTRVPAIWEPSVISHATSLIKWVIAQLYLGVNYYYYPLEICHAIMVLFEIRKKSEIWSLLKVSLSCCLPESDGWNTLESLLAFVLPSDPKVGWQEKRGANIRPHPWGWWSMLGIWDNEIVRCPARKWPQSGPGSEGKQCVNMATIWEYALQHRTYLWNKKENIIEQNKERKS